MPLLAVGCMAFAAEPLFDEVPQIAVTPLGKQIVDGKRDADEDRFSAGMYGFCMLQMKQFPAEARFNVSTDGKHLFLSAQCETGPDGILQRSRKGRGGERAFLDDSFEFVIIPNPEAAAPSIYHLILNNRGSYMAAGKSGAGNIAWDPKFTYTGNVRGNLWTFELTLPLSQFGISEWKDGQSIGLRFCRNWRRLKKEFGGDWGRQTSWEQKYAQFFSSDFLPKLTLRREAPVVRFLSLRKGKEPDIRVSLFNPGKTPLALRLFYRHQPINSQSVTREDSLTLAPGEKRELSLPTAQITEGETISTAFKVTSLDGEKIYYHRAFTWQLEQPEDRISLCLLSGKRQPVCGCGPECDERALKVEEDHTGTQGQIRRTACFRDNAASAEENRADALETSAAEGNHDEKQSFRRVYADRYRTRHTRCCDRQKI